MAETAHVRLVGSIPVIDLQGKITLGESSAKVRELIDQLLAQGKPGILLNMSNVSYVDSAGLGAIASCHVKAHGSGGGVSLCQVSQRVAELLELTRLNEKLKIYADEETGLTAMGPDSPAPVSNS